MKSNNFATVDPSREEDKLNRTHNTSVSLPSKYKLQMKDFKAKIADKKTSYVSPYSSSRAKISSPGRTKVGNSTKDSKIL